LRKILSILFTVMLVLSFNLLMAIPAIAALNGSASISPAEADYDLSHPDDVETTITWNDANSIISIVDGDDTLVEGAHYTVGYFDGTARLTIGDDYLAAKLLAVGDSVELTINFNVYAPATFTITAIAMTSATIDPEVADYDLSHPDDVETTITWNDANSIVSIVDEDTTLVEGTHYTVGSFDGTAILAIWDDYLAAKLLAVGDSVELTINFDVYDPTTFTITAIFEEILEYDLTISSTAGGCVIEPGEGTFTYDEGTVVDLMVAVELSSSRFVEWTGDVDTIADVNAATTNITMYDDYSITANFEEILPPVNRALIVGIIAAVVIVGLVIFFVRRKRAA